LDVAAVLGVACVAAAIAAVAVAVAVGVAAAADVDGFLSFDFISLMCN